MIEKQFSFYLRKVSSHCLSPCILSIVVQISCVSEHILKLICDLQPEPVERDEETTTMILTEQRQKIHFCFYLINQKRTEDSRSLRSILLFSGDEQNSLMDYMSNFHSLLLREFCHPFSELRHCSFITKSCHFLQVYYIL